MLPLCLQILYINFARFSSKVVVDHASSVGWSIVLTGSIDEDQSIPPTIKNGSKIYPLIYLL